MVMVSSYRTHVDQMYEDSNEVSEYLRTQQTSFLLIADEIFRKYLLVAAASYFESRVKEILLDYVRESTNGNDRLIEFVRNTVTARGYHTLFAWDAPNANQFWRLFGESFRSTMRTRVRGDAALEEAVKAFLELTLDRNRLVHENFDAFSLEKTSPEIYDSYRKGLQFVENLPQILRDSM